MVCFIVYSPTCPLFQVLEEAVSARFRSVSYLHTRGPGLAGHLSALQHAIMADLATVRHLLEHCVPSHYQITRAYLRASNHCLHAHLAQVSDGGEINCCCSTFSCHITVHCKSLLLVPVIMFCYV